MAHWMRALLAERKQKPKCHTATKRNLSMQSIPDSIAAVDTKEVVNLPRETKEAKIIKAVVVGKAHACQDNLPITKALPGYEHIPDRGSSSNMEKKVSLKEWPDNPHSLVDYEDLVKPIKAIIDQGYKLTRNLTKSFTYEGYEIGAKELEKCPSAKYRFDERLLSVEKKKSDRNLIDVALNMIYLLGVENGRRAERKTERSADAVIETLSSYREANKDLRFRIDELEAKLELVLSNPQASQAELFRLTKQKLQDSRHARMQACREDIAIDPFKSRVAVPDRRRTSFKALVDMLRELSCTKNEWTSVLSKHGWLPSEWFARADKDRLTLKFSD